MYNITCTCIYIRNYFGELCITADYQATSRASSQKLLCWIPEVSSLPRVTQGPHGACMFQGQVICKVSMLPTTSTCTFHFLYPLRYAQYMWLSGIILANRITGGKRKTVPPHLFWRRHHVCSQLLHRLPYFLVFSLNLGDDGNKFPTMAPCVKEIPELG